jgi:hypothetical protein
MAFSDLPAEVAALYLRKEIHIDEIPAPQKLAPAAYAISADIALNDEEDLATGRFVILHDPQGQEAWNGLYRCVTYIRSAIDEEIKDDPLLPDVAWSWFLESLEKSGIDFRAPSGTVTKVLSASFGELAQSESSCEIEIRASWTPVDPSNLIANVQAWLLLLEIVSGLTPLPDGALGLPLRR